MEYPSKNGSSQVHLEEPKINLQDKVSNLDCDTSSDEELEAIPSTQLEENMASEDDPFAAQLQEQDKLVKSQLLEESGCQLVTKHFVKLVPSLSRRVANLMPLDALLAQKRYEFDESGPVGEIHVHMIGVFVDNSSSNIRAEVAELHLLEESRVALRFRLEVCLTKASDARTPK
ncbi:hypothetical protein L7F22_043304 [Adiantum nelumboides]|nr:hypothetical protein [Adiantum nelumboides]